MTDLYSLSSFRVGNRVQMHPATTFWMQGARYGEVVNIGKACVVINLDRRRYSITVSPDKIAEIL